MTLSDFLASLKADVATSIAAIEASAGEFVHTIIPIIEADLALAFSQLKQVAIDAVLELAHAKFAAMSGTEKFGTAVTRVFMHAEAKAVAIAIEDVRLLVQQTYDTARIELSK